MKGIEIAERLGSEVTRFQSRRLAAEGTEVHSGGAFLLKLPSCNGLASGKGTKIRSHRPAA